uniref:Uncharacterized protein n=1 Tax=Kalanchoe fedtschenkoi TaxID=63787 RepID=A0A7N0V5C2_KALFE
MSGRRNNRTVEEHRIDEVEELLKATEDELLLDLTVGSHTSKVAPSYIDSDLNRRFQALKRPSSSSSSVKPVFNLNTPPPQGTPADGGGDLLARFAALKGSRHASSLAASDLMGGSEESGLRKQVGADSEEEDEVEKMIQWAKDAARLDPSPPTDSDDSENFQPSDVDDDDDDDDSEDEEEERKSHQKKKMERAKKKGLH